MRNNSKLWRNSTLYHLYCDRSNCQTTTSHSKEQRKCSGFIKFLTAPIWNKLLKIMGEKSNKNKQPETAVRISRGKLILLEWKLVTVKTLQIEFPCILSISVKKLTGIPMYFLLHLY